MKHFKISIDLYGCKILFIFGKGRGAKKILKKEISKKKLRRWEFKGCDGLTMMYDGFGIIWLREEPLSPSMQGTLAHECLHMVDFIMRRCEVTRDDNGNEASTYLLGHIIEQVYKSLE